MVEKILTYCDGLVCECQPCLIQGQGRLSGWMIQYGWRCLARCHCRSRDCHTLHFPTCGTWICDLPEILFLSDVQDHTRKTNPSDYQLAQTENKCFLELIKNMASS